MIRSKKVRDIIMETARMTIEDAIETDGPYSHNICSLALSNVQEKLGTKYANRLVDEHGLTLRYGIKKVNLKLKRKEAA